MWQRYKNQQSEMTVLLYFLLATSCYTSFFLEVLSSWRNFQDKIACFEIFQKILKTPILWGKLHPLECVLKICFGFYLVAFFVGYVVVYSNFSVGFVFVEQFAKQNCHFSEFLQRIVWGHVLGEDKFSENTQKTDNFVSQITPQILHLQKIWSIPRRSQRKMLRDRN